jgi:hypothetical protein
MLASEKKFSIEELLAREATRWDRRIASDLAAELETQMAEKLETIPGDQAAARGQRVSGIARAAGARHRQCDGK